MEKTRRVVTAVLAGGFLLALTVVAIAQVRIQPGRPFPGGGGIVINPGFPGQPQPQPQPSAGDIGSQFSEIQLTEKSEYRQYIQVAKECIIDEAWNQAVTALQAILDNEEDFYIRVTDRDSRGGEVQRWTSVKYEANKLLGTIPRKGLDVYEVRYGGQARALLNEAKKTGDIELLAEVAQRFLNTSVGPEANDLLATYFLDRGQFFMAALRYERLLSLPPTRYKTSDLTLLKAALAYRRAGDLKKSEAAWQRLAPRLRQNGGLKLGNKRIPPPRLQKILDELPMPKSAHPHDWALVRGNLTNSAQANGSQPLLDEVLWKRPTIRDVNDITGIQDDGAKAEVWIKQAISNIRDDGSVPVMPGFFPIAVNGKLIYRNYSRIVAVALHEEKDDDGEILVKPGELEWQSVGFDGSLAVALEKPQFQATLEGWLNSFKGSSGIINLVYENSLVGTLSSDLKRVYAIDDLAVPIPPTQVQMLMNPNLGGNVNLTKTIKDRLFNNVLYAYDINTGKIAWRRGGFDTKKNQFDVKFQESLFLGPPLPVGGKLYLLNERSDGELRLICFDPANGKVIPPIQTLGTVNQSARLAYDANRRTHAVHLAYGEGILICPTNAGQVIGVDLLSRTLAWAYPYRERRNGDIQGGPIFPGGQPIPISLTPATWKVAPPVIEDGKVVFTAPDAHSLHCLNLRDGTLAWKQSRNTSDLFLAGVIDGKVVIIGKNSCTARRLDDGSHLWTVTTGDLPSGQGVSSNNIYYLPLQNGEICAIDVKNGVVKAHNRPSSDDAEKPGNLIFYEGAVLSQTPQTIVAYPQLTSKLTVVKNSVKKDPKDLAKVTLYGELLLADGQVQAAVDKFLEVNAKNPPQNLRPRVRQRLYESLTDLFQVDFKTASTKYMAVYKNLLNEAANTTEEQRRKGKFLRILGQGREAEGNLVAAYQAYRDFEQVKLYREAGVPAIDDPQRKIPMDVWVRGRIAQMFADARESQRKPLEAKISEDWQRVRQTQDMDKIRGFVSMFDMPFPVGREARLYLANAIIEKKDRGSFLEAELKLEQLRSEQYKFTELGAKALEALARLEKEKGAPDSMRTSVSYYRRLADQFPNTVIREGKTGKDLFGELTADKRYLPYLGAGGSSWGNSPLKARELPAGSINTDLFGFAYRPKGELTPSTSSLRLVLENVNTTRPRLKVVDLRANKVIGNLSLTIPGSNQQMFNYYRNIIQQAQNNSAYYPDAAFRFFHVKGHLAVFQMASEVYGIDLENPRVLWHQSLFDIQELIKKQYNLNGMTPDANGNLRIMIYNRALRRMQQVSIGHIGTAQASYVCLLKKDDLLVLNPLKGEVMWSKSDVPEGTEIFGDDQYIFLNEGGGAGRVLRASDGSHVQVANFNPIYNHRLHVQGRRILAATPGANGLLLRNYDIPTGKDVWTRKMAAGSVLLHSENSDITGAIEPDGKATIVDVKTGKVLAQVNLLQGRVGKADIQNLQRPILLADGDHYYIALNKAVDNQEVMGGTLLNNFTNGLGCAPVNGWICAFHRHDGSRKSDGKVVTYKRGDFHWHSSKPILHQMIVTDQFEDLPILLFTVRYNQAMRNNVGIIGSRSISYTQSINKRTGKWVHCPIEPRTTNGTTGRFNSFVVNQKEGTIEMIGYTGVLQHFVDDGRPRREKTSSNTTPQGNRPLNPGGIPPNVFPGGRFGPGQVLPGGFNPPPAIINPIRINRAIRLPVQPPRVPPK